MGYRYLTQRKMNALKCLRDGFHRSEGTGVEGFGIGNRITRKKARNARVDARMVATLVKKPEHHKRYL